MGTFCFYRLYLPGRTKKEDGMGRRWTAEDIANLKKLAQQYPLPFGSLRHVYERTYRERPVMLGYQGV